MTREGYVPSSGGIQLYYQVLGQGPDTIVVVHGGPGAGMNTILPHARALEDTFTLVFYDQRGGGRSTLPADTTLLHIRQFVEDLESVRRFFGLDRMRLLAHSFGALLVAEYLVSHPDRVERAVFLAATGPRRAPAAAAARDATFSPEGTPSAQRQAELLRTLLRGEADEPVETCRDYERVSAELARARGDTTEWQGSTCAAPAEAVRYFYRYTAQITPPTLGDWDYTERLGHIKAPLLVVHGDRHPDILDAQREWAAALGNGRLLVIPGSGRASIAERPDLTIPAITSFLQGIWPSDALFTDEG
jgi:proline iminopeptidase